MYGIHYSAGQLTIEKIRKSIRIHKVLEEGGERNPQQTNI